MATYNLKRFSDPDTLRAIQPENLRRLLAPHAEYLQARGVKPTLAELGGPLDYEGLVHVFMSPDSDTPSKLADALYYVHEMATVEGMDAILEETKRRGIQTGPDPTPADVAVLLWLEDRELLEQKHAERYLTRPRSFQYYQARDGRTDGFRKPSRALITRLEEALDDWFEEKKRGRGARVFVYPKDEDVWFLVRHGEPYKREGCLDAGRSSSVFYRPEKHDVLVYHRSVGDMGINARSRGEKELYRSTFGLHLFGDESFFPGTAKYSLEPLRQKGESSLVCSDVEGLDWVRLKEIRFLWGGAVSEIEIRKADDIFAALKARRRELPKKPRLLRASFLVKFTDSATPRTASVRPSNIAEYTRDNDGGLVEEWLRRRGFLIGKDRPG